MQDLVDWSGVAFDAPERIAGDHAVLERLRADRHADDLARAFAGDADAWRYMPYGPFADAAAYHDWAEGAEAAADPYFYAIGAGGTWVGTGAIMRVDRANGVAEIGHLAFSSALRRSVVATETFHLMLDLLFAAGFRRVEWKCDAGNAASLRAAKRLGFVAEGVFRQHLVVKGANRDTAWFSILDREWPDLRAAHRAWLDPGNVGADGLQRRSLADLVAGTRPT